MSHPVEIYRQKQKLPFLPAVISAVHHTQTAKAFFLRNIPGLIAVIRNIRIPKRLVIYTSWLFVHMKNAVFFPNGNGFLHKGKNRLAALYAAPVYPAQFIVLTPDIVVSLLGIAPFISLINQRRPLGRQKKCKGIFQLLQPQLPNTLFPGRAFRSAVPGTVVFDTVLIVFFVCLIVPLLIRYHIHHGEPVLVCHIINDAAAKGISFAAEHELLHHALFSLQKTAHTVEKSFIVFCRPFIKRLFPVQNGLSIHIVKKQFASRQKRVFHKQGLGNVFSHKVKSIHMVLGFPVAQNIQYRGGRCLLFKIKFHEAFQIGAVKGIYQMFKFFHRAGRGGKCRLWSKVTGLPRIAPTVYPPDILLLLLRRAGIFFASGL